MIRKLNRESIEKIINGLGYELLDEYICKDGRNRKAIIKDKIGYKYDVYFQDIARRNRKIRPFHTGNHFTLDNIKLWLFFNNKTFELCENNVYEGNNKKLFFHCLKTECDEIFDSSWNEVSSQERCCPFCSGQRPGKHNNLATLRPDLADDWNYEYNEDSPEDYTYGSGIRKYWICSKCGYGGDGGMVCKNK